MKRVVVLYEGAADEPQGALDGRTPLEVARGPQCSALAAAGAVGVIEPLPGAGAWRTEVLLGMLAGLHRDEAMRLRRGPFEAACLDPSMPDAGTVYRGTFVTLDGSELREVEVDRLSMGETQALCAAVGEACAAKGLAVRIEALGPGAAAVQVPGTTAGHWDRFPPGTLRGADAEALLAEGYVSAEGCAVVEVASAVLPAHAVNEVRVDLGENPANGLWLWGGGGADVAAPLRGCGNGRTVVLTGGRPGRALARLAGMTCLELGDPYSEAPEEPALAVPALVEALRSHDTLLVHVPAPLEGGRYGDPRSKVRMLDRLDQHLLVPLKAVLDAYRPYRLALLSDGAVASGTAEPLEISLPVVLAGEGITPDDAERWAEPACAGGGLGSMDIERFLRIFSGA